MCACTHTHTLLVNRVCQIPHTPKRLIGFLFKWKPRDYPQALGSGPGLPPHLHPSPGFLNKRGFKVTASYVNSSRSREDALQVGAAWFLGPMAPCLGWARPHDRPLFPAGFFLPLGGEASSLVDLAGSDSAVHPCPQGLPVTAPAGLPQGG